MLVDITASLQEISRWVQRTPIINPPYRPRPVAGQQRQKRVPSFDRDHAWMGDLVPGEITSGAVSRFCLLFHTHQSLFDPAEIVVNRHLT